MQIGELAARTGAVIFGTIAACWRASTSPPTPVSTFGTTTGGTGRRKS
jgi:hypothetical protein